MLANGGLRWKPSGLSAKAVISLLERDYLSTKVINTAYGLSRLTTIDSEGAHYREG
jgi:hypothetical protein